MRQTQIINHFVTHLEYIKKISPFNKVKDEVYINNLGII